MSCGITGDQWTDYFDRVLPAVERRGIESHLLSCEPCRAEAKRVRLADEMLRNECGALVHSLKLASPSASRDRIIAKLRDSEGPPVEVREKLRRVRWVLAMLCGDNTAGRVIESAHCHAAAAVSTEVSEQSWLHFVRRLSLLTTEICGSDAGDLILAVAR